MNEQPTKGQLDTIKFYQEEEAIFHKHDIADEDTGSKQKRAAEYLGRRRGKRDTNETDNKKVKILREKIAKMGDDERGRVRRGIERLVQAKKSAAQKRSEEAGQL